MVQIPLITPELRDFSLALALCPDHAAVDRAVRRYTPAVAGFLFITRNVEQGIADGICKVDSSVDIRVCPYFYLSQYVSSCIANLDQVMEEKRKELGG